MCGFLPILKHFMVNKLFLNEIIFNPNMQNKHHCILGRMPINDKIHFLHLLMSDFIRDIPFKIFNIVHFLFRFF